MFSARTGLKEAETMSTHSRLVNTETLREDLTGGLIVVIGYGLGEKLGLTFQKSATVTRDGIINAFMDI